MGRATLFTLGDVVHLEPPAGDPLAAPDAVFVVVAINTHSNKIRIAKCAGERWQAAHWMLAEAYIKADPRSKDRKVRRARRWLAEIKPDPDGWKRIKCGKAWAPESCVVGHVSLDAEASHG